MPRLVNILAHKSLLLVYGEGGRQVERRHVRAAVEDTPAAQRALVVVAACARRAN